MTAAKSRSDNLIAETSPRPRAGAAPSAFASVDGQTNQIGAAMLLAVEARVRAAKDETEIAHLIVNELRKLVAGRQAILLRASGKGRFKLLCVSSVVVTEKDTPFVRWIQRMVGEILAEHGETEAIAFDLPAFTEPDAVETSSYPFRHFIWQPMRLSTGEAFAGVLVARDRPWPDQDRQVVTRESEVFASYWQALHGAKAMRQRPKTGRKMRLALAAFVIAAAFFPVPMTTLAPVEIVAATPQRVTAPLDGVIKEILVAPNRRVKAGQLILRFDATMLRNRHQIAEREMQLAEAKYIRLSQAAFIADDARHELAQARAEFDLKKAELEFAAQMLGRSQVVAEHEGVLVYADQDRWIGRPVRTGERIMQIVDPGLIAARIELPVADAIVLERGARARLFLDANPLNAIGARISSEAYQAEPNANQQLVYRIHAEFEDGNEGLRIGARGTAQLVGREVPLAFYLFRRPISALRQHLGF